MNDDIDYEAEEVEHGCICLWRLNQKGEPQRIFDPVTWAIWMEQTDRRVNRTVVGPAVISTIFLGVDHNFIGKGPPILFETLVFGGPLDGEMVRYPTRELAETGHMRTVGRCRAVMELPAPDHITELPR